VTREDPRFRGRREDPRLRLDGVEPLVMTGAEEPHALGRDPFAEDDAADPLLDALAFLPPPRPRPRPAPESPPPRGAIERWMGDDVLRRLDGLAAAADAEGLSAPALRRAMPPFLALYRAWFRVRSEGHEHLPRAGPAILVANHAGLLPFDAAMVTLDVLLKTEPPRLPRAIFDRFVGKLPPVRRFFEAVGAVMASRESLGSLLKQERIALVFPEGIDGIVKPVTQRYRLQHFHTGFVRQALAAAAPVIPVAVVGSDDQAPILYDVKPLARRLGLPVAPVTPTFPWLGPLGLLPLPVRYRIVYGAPIDIGRLMPGAARSDREIDHVTKRVRREVQHLLDRARER
jgi:1-acyl-sn-glycerol-3-phosphate acyltransferase